MEFNNQTWRRYFKKDMSHLMKKYGLTDPLVVRMGERYFLAEKSEVDEAKKSEDEEGDFIMLYQDHVITHASREELPMTSLP